MRDGLQYRGQPSNWQDSVSSVPPHKADIVLEITEDAFSSDDFSCL